MSNVIYSCIKHVEELLDVFLDEIEELPLIEEVAGVKVLCHKCQEIAVYKLSGSEVKATWG
ncbi:MAG: CxxH/CxxC protein [Defluviitaleaceae bacterium]|nr:CxxH/CxxC protein [Defluviitaleaceae bacterium]